MNDKAITKISKMPLVRSMLKWDWEKIAVGGIIALALANVMMFIKNRGR